MKKKRIENKNINIDLIATNLNRYPDAVPFVTFSSEQDPTNSDVYNFTLKIIAFVPYKINKENISTFKKMNELSSLDRKKRIRTWEVIIKPPNKKSKKTLKKQDPNIQQYYIHITYTINKPTIKDQRVFVFFEEQGSNVQPDIPTTTRGTVVTTAIPPK